MAYVTCPQCGHGGHIADYSLRDKCVCSECGTKLADFPTPAPLSQEEADREFRSFEELGWDLSAPLGQAGREEERETRRPRRAPRAYNRYAR